MKPYSSVLKLRLLNGMQYRSAALAGVATQFFWGFMYIMIFEAFYSSVIDNPPISLEELVVYLWLQQSFLAFIMLWFRDNELFDLITTGNIAYELCRPCGIYGYWYAKLLAQRLSSAFLRSFPILLVAFLLPEPYRMSLPPSFITFVLFLITLILGLFILVAISMFIYISVFITLSPVGSLLVFGVIGEFFAGLVIPIPLMPSWLKEIAYMLPFRLTADFPFRVYSGHIPQSDALVGIVLQLVWLLVLVLLGRYALKKALQKVVVQGG
ncbi:ABC transporter permease [Alkalihalobacillus sp. AL-G]|uniref:ABC transporter permease n=1 Tax=Alkalihalobacillus sp. AL-G TaxID=2926399 RepID=UPI00272B869D|nr:ABC transporter permease [Alkalihalobacillus sp. AL-G]WLD94508.1 ABC transporter permease [Alkalihalobacillus sp. AL-G]